MSRATQRRVRGRAHPATAGDMISDLALAAGSVETMAAAITDVLRDGMPVQVAAAMLPELERIEKACGDLARLLRPGVEAAAAAGLLEG